MNQNDEAVEELLRSAIGPIPDFELSADLWPKMLARMNSTRHWSIWDWVAVAGATAAVAAFPGALSLILYAL